MKEFVKYILIIGLGILAFYHFHEVTPFTICLYFNTEYSLLTIILMYLAVQSKGREKLLFGISSGYFGLKIIYNTLLCIEPLGVKLGLNNSEEWGAIFTCVIIVILIIIQYRYVIKEG
jgi:hypothetical protein